MKMLVSVTLALMALAAIPSKASAEIILCNETAATIEYAMVWDEGIPVIAPIWKTAGWYRLAAGACITRLKGSVRQELYLSIRRLTPQGPVLALYRLDERNYYTKGMYGIEDVFCVKRGGQAFERTVQRLEQLRDCPDGWVGQTYNMLGFTTAGISFTMHLGEARLK
jgi:Protein of unknown function (DUF1036)